MNSKALWFIIIVLIGVVLYLLFVPPAPAVAPMTDSLEEVSEELMTVPDVEPTTTQEAVDEPETAELEFTAELVGFTDGTQSGEDFTYALVNDGTEILRLDLRPLIGNDTTGVEATLGVQVGEPVLVGGHLEAGVFVIEYLRRG